MRDSGISSRILEAIACHADDEEVRVFLVDLLYKEAEGLRLWKDTYERMIGQHCDQQEAPDENRGDQS